MGASAVRGAALVGDGSPAYGVSPGCQAEAKLEAEVLAPRAGARCLSGYRSLDDESERSTSRAPL